jgi:hypothetical protein
MGNGGTKQGHNAIAEDLVDGALEAVHGVHHMVDGRIEELLGRFRVEPPDEFRWVFEVGKQHRDVLALTFQDGTHGTNFVRKMRWRVGEGAACLAAIWCRHTDGGWRSGGGLALPDEDALLIHRHALAVNEFLLEVLQCRVIELKVPLEHPVGDTTAALQHREGLIHHLFKGHRCLSPFPGMPWNADVPLW